MGSNELLKKCHTNDDMPFQNLFELIKTLLVYVFIFFNREFLLNVFYEFEHMYDV